jgi:small subunit ribosomal protein S6
MREYEMIMIIHPDLDETAFTEVVQRVTGWITEDGGEVLKTDLWGKRELAYPIRKLSQGQYVLLQIKMAPQSGFQLERNLRYLEPVIRYILTKK